MKPTSSNVKSVAPEAPVHNNDAPTERVLKGQLSSEGAAVKQPDLHTIMEQIEALHREDPSALGELANKIRQADHLASPHPQVTAAHHHAHQHAAIHAHQDHHHRRWA